jgi:NAD+ synthase
MRPQLKEHVCPAIMNFVRQKVEESGGSGVVIGLSGGIDSMTVSKICADALGPEKVLNIFMPSHASSDEDRRDAEDFCHRMGMELLVVDIEPTVRTFYSMLPSSDRKELAGNIMARCRMIVLFHHAKVRGRVVMGTSNKSELLIGYFTKFGDGGSDFCPLGDLYKTEVRQLAELIKVPRNIIDKVPSAGLWEGQTDEGEMGISYDDLDQILYGIERSLTGEEIAGETGLSMNKVEMVWAMHRSSVHKRKTPLIPKLGIRTLGLDWRE